MGKTSGFKAKQCHPRFWRKGCRPAEADRLSAAARIRAKATQYLDKRMDTLLESGQKAYEVKVVMETLRLIADMEKSDAGAAEEAAVQIVEDLTQ